jgi:outer membrane protein
MKKVFFTIIGALLFSTSVFAADLKIGVLDLQKVLASAPQVEAMKAKLKSQFDPKGKELESLQNTLKADVAKYQKNEAVMKDQDRKGMQEKIMGEQKQLQEKQGSFQQSLVAAQNQAMQTILKQVQDIVSNIATKDKYDLILLKAALGYSKDNMEITNQVIDAMKKA